MDNFHWVLFSFCMTRSKVFVFDSLYKTTGKSRYQDVVELIKTAWNCLCDKYIGKFHKNLYVHYDWPVCVFASSSILTLLQ
jgi:predicted RNA-binding protein with PIN domain